MSASVAGAGDTRGTVTWDMHTWRSIDVAGAIALVQRGIRSVQLPRCEFRCSVGEAIASSPSPNAAGAMQHWLQHSGNHETWLSKSRYCAAARRGDTVGVLLNVLNVQPDASVPYLPYPYVSFRNEPETLWMPWLRKAVLEGNVDVVRALLNAGASMDTRNIAPRRRALSGAHAGVTPVLVDAFGYGMRSAFPDDTAGLYSPLHTHRAAIVRALCDAGALPGGRRAIAALRAAADAADDVLQHALGEADTHDTPLAAVDAEAATMPQYYLSGYLRLVASSLLAVTADVSAAVVSAARASLADYAPVDNERPWVSHNAMAEVTALVAGTAAGVEFVAGALRDALLPANAQVAAARVLMNAAEEAAEEADATILRAPPEEDTYVLPAHACIVTTAIEQLGVTPACVSALQLAIRIGAPVRVRLRTPTWRTAANTEAEEEANFAPAVAPPTSRLPRGVLATLLYTWWKQPSTEHTPASSALHEAVDVLLDAGADVLERMLLNVSLLTWWGRVESRTMAGHIGDVLCTLLASRAEESLTHAQIQEIRWTLQRLHHRGLLCHDLLQPLRPRPQPDLQARMVVLENRTAAAATGGGVK